MPYSYSYSRYGEIWGWGTWRSRWEKYSSDITPAIHSGLFEQVLSSLEPWEFPEFRREQFNAVINGLDAWDYQWLFNRIANKALSVVPRQNLIKNIGFGEDATHTRSASNQEMMPLMDLDSEIVAPPTIERALLRDKLYVRKAFRHRRTLLHRARAAIARYRGRI